MTDKKYFLGVDAGASHTRVTIVNRVCEMIVTEHGEGANFTPQGFEKSAQRIMLLIHAALRTSGISPHDIESSVLGIAGLDLPSDLDLFRTLISEHFYMLGMSSPFIVNDVVIAMAAGTDNPNSIAIIAGTGSNCFGINSEGKRVWVGGLDYILSDEGSGYAIGVDVLRAAIKSWDGRILKTELEKAVLEHFRVRTGRELKQKVYSPDFNKADFAKLSAFAFSHQHDSISSEILRKNAKELVMMIMAAAHSLFIDKRDFDVVLTGGLFKNEIYVELVKTGTEKAFSNARVIFPARPSVWGAAKLATQAVNAPSLLGVSPGA